MTDITETITAILDGTFDDHLDDIRGALKERQTIKARTSFFTFKTGDKATLTNLRPKYLVGAPVTVVSKKQTRIAVVIDAEWLSRHPECRFRGEITAKPDMLNPVVDEEAA